VRAARSAAPSELCSTPSCLRSDSYPGPHSVSIHFWNRDAPGTAFLCCSSARMRSRCLAAGALSALGLVAAVPLNAKSDAALLQNVKASHGVNLAARPALTDFDIVRSWFGAMMGTGEEVHITSLAPSRSSDDGEVRATSLAPSRSPDVPASSSSPILPASDSSLSSPNATGLQYGDRRLVADHDWVEVMRFATACSAAREGLSPGFKADCGPEYVKMGRPELSSCDKWGADVGYGCWFFFSSPISAFGVAINVSTGSGVAINVGRSLRVNTRAEASKALGLPCADPPLCEKPGTVQDKLYCERARERGYDSIQFARPHVLCGKGERCFSANPPEMVLCTGGCMTERTESACPPGVELRRMGSKGTCKCSEDSDFINCGHNAMLYGRPDNGTQKCKGQVTSPEIYEFIHYLVPESAIPIVYHKQRKAMRRVHALAMRMNVTDVQELHEFNIPKMLGKKGYVDDAIGLMAKRR
jgi:hypothetical protein